MVLSLLLIATSLTIFSQDFQSVYDDFKFKSKESFISFRDECNKKYADFLRTAWEWYEGEDPMPYPKDKKTVPPKPYEPTDLDEKPIIVHPHPINPTVPNLQPKPISPIRENPTPGISFPVSFYGLTCEIRIPQNYIIRLNDISSVSLGNAWEALCCDDINNTIRDCLGVRIQYNLCDWAYLQFLQEFASQFCIDHNAATFFAAFLFCQSGYKMRLGEDQGDLVLLFGCDNYIYNMPYFILDGSAFYPLGKTSGKIKICNADFKGENPISLYIAQGQKLGFGLSEERTIKSKNYSDLIVSSKVPIELIRFYDGYPTSVSFNNPLTRWAMYADTPLSEETIKVLYPSLKKSIEGLSQEDAANKLLNWIQTGFVYEFDDNVWGHDRAFFSEETLYYPYADCEDRSILYSRLVRDLLGLDVALIYYPGHLATAVKFDSDVPGDVMMICGNRFIICDPTYIGAPIGKQMPNLEYDKAEAILLKRQ